MTAVDPARSLSSGRAPRGPVGATRTACPYCGVVCGVLATPDGRGGAAISGDPEHPANFGRLCSKGWALGETLGLENRLLYPMVRCSKGSMERIAWPDALDMSRTALRTLSRAMAPARWRSISPVNC